MATSMPARLIRIALAVLVLATLFVAGAALGYRTGITALADRGRADLTRAVDRLNSQMERYATLPAVLGEHPLLQSLSLNPAPGQVLQANRLLERATGHSGALDIYLKDITGTVIATSNHALPRSFMGRNYDWRPYFIDAMAGELAGYHAVGVASDQRGYYFSHTVSAQSRVTGVLTVKVDLEGIEDVWRDDPQTLFFSDRNDVIFLSNREAFLLRRLGDANSPLPERQYAERDITALPEISQSMHFGQRIWDFTDTDILPGRAVLITMPVDRIDMTGHILLPSDAAEAQALIWGALAATLGGIIVLTLTVLSLRRRALARELAREEQAKAELEQQVARRTKALRETNAQLFAEVEERKQAEATLRRVQDELVQAGKLTSLGEMAAGISHELNQPLTAMQTLADSTAILIQRERFDDVIANTGKIAQLATRMGRIIKNLRAFARKEGEPATDVDLVAVVNDALGLSEGRLTKAGALVIWSPPADPVLVRGGQVRLQQVVINLISNALDAMAGQTGPQTLTLTLYEGAEATTLSLRDSGPGLSAPDRVFDPFYSTKTVGEGLGLGLSISYGIVQSFGGRITGQNYPEGGAIFTMTLTPVSLNRAVA